ncbi:MAG TPA: hypothetical protein PK299_01790 [Anaerolineales bacterium]|nr:hypothetical protein [Anaerolineales bacterium]
MHGAVQKILACEFRFTNEMHTPFNAAWLKTLALAFPQSKLFFASAKSYQSHVENVEKHHGVFTLRENRTLEIPTDNELVRSRSTDWKIFFQIYQLYREIKPDILFYNSTSPYAILFTKLFLWLGLIKCPVYVVLHGELSAHCKRPKDKKSMWYRAFHWLNHPQLNYVVLSEVIYRELLKVDPGLASESLAIEHPYLWHEHKTHTANDSDTLSIAHLGVINVYKSIESLLHLVDKTQSLPGIQYKLIGSVTPKWKEISTEEYERVITLGASRVPITTDDYYQAVANIDYSIGFGNKRYRYSTSASFLDSLSFIKPCILIENEYVAHFFSLMGNIGYLCKSVAEMQALVEQLSTNFDADLYAQQQANILKGRDVFNPQRVANVLRARIE